MTIVVRQLDSIDQFRWSTCRSNSLSDSRWQNTGAFFLRVGIKLYLVGDGDDKGGRLNTSENFMRIAYLINQYPKLSHSFIRREILALERAGHHVTRIALRGWDGDITDDEDIAERARTQYVLRGGTVLGFGLCLCIVLL